MKQKAIFFSAAFLALVLALTTLTSVSATNSTDFVQIEGIWVDDINALTDDVAVEAGKTIEIDIEFVALKDAKDVRLKAYVEGFRDEFVESTERFHVVEGKRYTKTLLLKLPSSKDLERSSEEDELVEELYLNIRASAREEDAVEEEVLLTLQRELYSLDILSAEFPTEVTAGSVVPFEVVIENNGNERLDNVYLKISIPDLGIERKVYVGDISPLREEGYDDIRDTISKKVYLSLPDNAAEGTYKVEIEAYNYDTETSVKKEIKIKSVEPNIVPVVTSKSIKKGEEAIFRFTVINPNNKMMVYTLTPEEAKGLIITLKEPVIVVPPYSAVEASVKVKATASAEEGTQIVTINLSPSEGAAKQVSFTLNIEGEAAPETGKRNLVLILTVILAIIFVVLLVILIVLLTKKPAEVEEGEATYY